MGVLLTIIGVSSADFASEFPSLFQLSAFSSMRVFVAPKLHPWRRHYVCPALR